MTLRCWLLVSFTLFVSSLSVATADPIDVNNPPQGLFSDEWSEVYMGGGKAGYAHTTMSRDHGRIHTSVTMKMKIGRAANPVSIATVQATRETLDGTPLSFHSEMDASVMKTSMRGTISDGRVTVISSQYGLEQTRRFEFTKGALMTWGLFRESILRGFAPGTHYTLQAYAPEMRLDGPVSAVTTVGKWETFDHHGQSRRGQRVSLTLQSPIGTLETLTWVDSEGQPLKALIPVPGLGNIVMFATDEATALRDFVPPEVFTTTVIAAGRSLKPKSIRRITYQLRGKTAGAAVGVLPTTGMQKVISQDKGVVELVVTRQLHRRHETSAATRGDVKASGRHNPPELAEYLESNLMMNLNDPKLIALARQAAGGETEPFALADRLRRFVTDYVETKSLNIGFATASEVCRTKEGDCSEHGVLLAALGRLNGLPSRVVVGLAYVPSFAGKKDRFGYHLWTEFSIDGRWIDFDAALRESDCSPTRIAFATSSLKNAGLADLSLPLLSKIGAIDIDIVKVEKMDDSAN